MLLPERLFINLIDLDLQRRIANSDNLDYDAAETIKELLKTGPRELRHDLADWTTELFEG